MQKQEQQPEYSYEEQKLHLAIFTLSGKIKRLEDEYHENIKQASEESKGTLSRKFIADVNIALDKFKSKKITFNADNFRRLRRAQIFVDFVTNPPDPVVGGLTFQILKERLRVAMSAYDNPPLTYTYPDVFRAFQKLTAKQMASFEGDEKIKEDAKVLIEKDNDCFGCGRDYLSREDPTIKLTKCSRCKYAKYCSRECQTSDWRIRHKVFCAAICARQSEVESEVLYKDALCCFDCGAFEKEDGSPLSICRGCNYAKYCCKEHQKQDWEGHRNECKFIQARKKERAAASLSNPAEVTSKDSSKGGKRTRSRFVVKRRKTRSKTHLKPRARKW